MIVSPDIASKIAEDKATQLRVLVDHGEQRYVPRVDKHGVAKRGASVRLVKPTTYTEGDRFPIKATQSREEKCHVLVVAVRRERHGDLTQMDAIRSGYKTTAAYKVAWVRRHDDAWIKHLEQDGPPVDDETLVIRFDQRHAHREVWVLDVERDRSGTARFLAASPGSSQADYVSSPAAALPGELEAVSADEQDRQTREAKLKPVVGRQQVYEEERAQIMASIERLESADLGREVGSLLYALKQRLYRLDGKIREAA